MNKQLFSCIAVIALLLTACSKDGDTINNYTTSDGGKIPNRTMLKGYGYTDSSSTLRFNYQNNELGKIKELISFDASGIPNLKVIILFNGANQPLGFQTYKLPINTLEGQGTFKVDKDGKVISVVKRETNGDTIGICNYQYGASNYQPISFSYFDKADNRYTTYEYFTYDKNGNVVKSIKYMYDNGTSSLYKAEESEADGFKGINGLNQLYYYLVSQGSKYGFTSSSTLYFSNYLPLNVRTQSFKVDGTNQSVSVSNLDQTVDENNNVILLNGVGGSSSIFLKY
jgi:uncharacterized protein YkuJ